MKEILAWTDEWFRLKRYAGMVMIFGGLPVPVVPEGWGAGEPGEKAAQGRRQGGPASD